MKKIYTALFITAFFSFFPLRSFAAEFRYPANAEDANTAVVLLKDEVVNDDLYIAGKDVVISGTVNGNVYAAGDTVTVNGEVKGDVFALGATVTISGKVDGSAHSFGGDVVFDAQAVVQKDVTNVSGSFITVSNAVVGRDLIFLGGTADIAGKVGGFVIARGNRMNFAGTVGSYADLMGNDVAVTKDANISGNLNVQTQSTGTVDADAHVGGTRSVVVTPIQKKAGADLMSGFWKSMTLLLIALLFVRLFPKKVVAIVQGFEESVGRNALWGILIFFVTIPVAFLLLFSVIGFPIGIALVLAYVVYLYGAAASVALFIGHKVLRLLKQNRPIGAFDALVGVFVMWLVALIPVVGGLIEAVLLIYTLGVLLRIDRRLYAVVKNADLTTPAK